MVDTKAVLKQVKELISEEKWAEALAAVRPTANPSDPFIIQNRIAKRIAPVAEHIDTLKPLKIAVLANTTVDHLVDVFKSWLILCGIKAEFYTCPFGMLTQSILDENSDFYAFKPDVVWLFDTFRDMHLPLSPAMKPEDVQSVVKDAVAAKAAMWQKLHSHGNFVILQNNVDIPFDDEFGNLAGAAPWGSRTALRLFNAELTNAAESGVIIFDYDHLSALYGKSRWVDARYWFHSKHPFDLDATGLVAHAAARMIASAKGLAKKCLVLDLDNTLWGGVIGDDGIDGIHLGAKADGEAFCAFQSYAKSLKERGIILAVCSKNEEENAKEPFLKHPDMRLSLDDIAVFRANWNNKVDNIRDIARVLNIGLDTFVFVDDNPAERTIVRQFLPMVEVPELPEDPSGYIAAIDSGRYFETVSMSAEDGVRARYYKENAQRAELQMTFKDSASYMKSLEMTGTVGHTDSFHLPRMAQLINKSNQFHLTGNRYSEADVTALEAREDTELRYFTLSDRFGDNGLISVLVLIKKGETLKVDTWVMSCRVLGRSMEEFIAAEIFAIARERGCSKVEGRYVPSPKNKLVSKLYERLGFKLVSDTDGTTIWSADLSSTPEPVTYIKREDAAENA